MPAPHIPSASLPHVLTLELEAAQAEALAETIRDRWALEPVELSRPGCRQVWLDVHFPAEDAARLAGEALRGHPGVRALVVCPTKTGGWNAAAHRHFPRRAVGRRLELCPVWASEEELPPHRVRLLINPGMSFGTGYTFTTSFCLAALDEVFEPAVPPSLLDLGTGSGILAIAAARLGCPCVCAVDVDEQALVQAREHVALNGVEEFVRLEVLDVTRDPIPGPFDVVCANLYASLLLEAAPRIAEAAGRVIILSGLRESEADAVADAFMALGWRETQRDGDGEWAGLVLRR